jgi:hypothetical protein
LHQPLEEITAKIVKKEEKLCGRERFSVVWAFGIHLAKTTAKKEQRLVKKQRTN